MEVIELAGEMQTISERLRCRDGAVIRLIPTMGALHAGHASLIEAASTTKPSGTATGDNNGRGEQSGDNRTPERKKPVLVVSIFTNPIQFNNPSDYQNYPKTWRADLELCKRLGVRYVFAPTCHEMYPTRVNDDDDGGRLGDSTTMVMPPERMADELEGRSRKGHFKGMLTVVCKLFNIIKPHEAFFGEKDYQQLRLVDQMVRDLNMAIVIVPGETKRDPDLLPLSSRNVRLSANQRRLAPIMTKILLDAKTALEQRAAKQTDDLNVILLGSMLTTMWLNLNDDECKQLKVDYLELRCAKDVSEICYQAELDGFDCRYRCASVGRTDDNCLAPLQTRLLTSTIIGQVRLLDNIEVILNSSNNKCPA